MLNSSKRNETFDRWYTETFGEVLGHQDDENREAVKKIWNGAMEHIAREFEFQIFDELNGDQIADKIRRLKAVKS
jgi:ATP:corrinoid adenosyltransferase